MQCYQVLILFCVYILEWTYGSQKKGLAHWAASYKCDDFKALDNMAWWYDWRMDLGYFHQHKICSASIDNYTSTHIPMVWGYYGASHFNIPDEASYILGYNEPNHRAQANLSPQKAAESWPVMEASSKGKPLVSPSAAPCGSNCNHGQTVNWFDEFFQHCNSCRVDYLATHAYYCNPDQTMHFLRDLYNRYGRKIWLTEFACSYTSDKGKTLNYMKHILPRLEAADFVYRYSWFMARITGHDNFINSAASLLEPDSSTLTQLGHFYNQFQGHSSPIVG